VPSKPPGSAPPRSAEGIDCSGAVQKPPVCSSAPTAANQSRLRSTDLSSKLYLPRDKRKLPGEARVPVRIPRFYSVPAEASVLRYEVYVTADMY
jgi:hypothetical protein